MIYFVLIPIGLLFVPWLLVRYVFATEATRDLSYRSHAIYLWVAAVVWELSQLLPEVPVAPNETSSFTMHFCGGVAAAILYVYALKAYKLRFNHVWQLWVGLFLFASALGVLNELFEFAGYRTGLMPPDTSTMVFTPVDTWWDLAANTTGSLVTLLIVRLIWHNSKRTHP